MMIGDKVKYIRLKKGLSQQKLSLKSGLTLRVITNLEQGISEKPTIQTMIKLADALNISLDELVGRNFKPSKH